MSRSSSEAHPPAEASLIENFSVVQPLPRLTLFSPVLFITVNSGLGFTEVLMNEPFLQHLIHHSAGQVLTEKDGLPHFHSNVKSRE